MRKRFTAQALRRSRWRYWIAIYALLALVWPALGPLPWLIDFAPDGHRTDRTVAHEEQDEHSALHSHVDASEFPGSPTHPDDHDCFECQVIQHLARCVPSVWSFPTVAVLPSRSGKPPLHIETIEAAFVTPRPPIRGPPLLDV
ncbi:MAG TPA: hypothetical protein VGL25_09075 [Casimicrobiaceae bacterium]